MTRFMGFRATGDRLGGWVTSRPLALKLVGVNLSLVCCGLLTLSLVTGIGAGAWILVGLWVTGGILATRLVYLALEPVREIEKTFEQVAQGNHEARVPQTRFEDSDMAQLRETANMLLTVIDDDFANQAARMAHARVEHSAERMETLRVIRESVAQTLFALQCQVRAMDESVSCEQKDLLRELVAQAARDVNDLCRQLEMWERAGHLG